MAGLVTSQGTDVVRLRDRPLVRKLWKYSMTSVVGTVSGQTLLTVFTQVLDWSWAWSNVAAVAISTIPSYLLCRAWVWKKQGKSSFYAEVLPFWVMTFLGLVLSTIVVAVLEHRYPDTPVMANVGNVIGFGVLWLAKFFVLDRVLFAATDEEPEAPLPMV
ncbi:MAG: GtrA family protein [Acidimicrobiia bacterium]